MTDRERVMEEANRLAACPALADNVEHVGCPFCAGTGLGIEPEPIADALLEWKAQGVEWAGKETAMGAGKKACDARAAELRAQKGGGK